MRKDNRIIIILCSSYYIFSLQTPAATFKKFQKENVSVRKRDKTLKDPDLVAFHSMVKNLRGE